MSSFNELVKFLNKNKSSILKDTKSYLLTELNESYTNLSAVIQQLTTDIDEINKISSEIGDGLVKVINNLQQSSTFINKLFILVSQQQNIIEKEEESK